MDMVRALVAVSWAPAQRFTLSSLVLLTSLLAHGLQWLLASGELPRSEVSAGASALDDAGEPGPSAAVSALPPAITDPVHLLMQRIRDALHEQVARIRNRRWQANR